MSVTGKLLLTLALITPADPATIADIPIIDRQAPDFYGAIADREKVMAEWRVEPNPVAIDSDTVLSLIVRNAANPTELTRPDLRQFDELTKQFQIEDLPNEPPANGVVVYRYQLRPRELGKHTITAMNYRYYRPRYPEGRRFQTIRLSPLVVEVVPAAEEPEHQAIPLTGSESFFVVVPLNESPQLPRWSWLVPIAVLPVLAAVGIGVGRWLFPDAARRAALRRHRAVRLALSRLAGADTAAAVTSALLDYLVSRHGLSSAATTPSEVSTSLQQTGWPRERVAEVEALLRQCDQARFSERCDSPVSLAERIAKQIEAWEEAAS